jgi:hypothetical protein
MITVLKAARSNFGRLGLGLATMLLWWVFLLPREHWTFDVSRLAAFLVAFVPWVWAELLGPAETEKARPHAEHAPGRQAHDQKLFEFITAKLGPDQHRFLREQDFGAPIHSFQMRPFSEAAETWKGVQYEFIDENLASVFRPVLENLIELCGMWAKFLGPMGQNAEILTVKTTQETRTGDRSAQTVANAKSMNDRADGLLAALERFERAGRYEEA